MNAQNIKKMSNTSKFNNQNIIEEFRKDFNKVRQQGWIKSKRSHNTGIGKTFEESIGIVENNSQDVDYKGLLEIKSKRALSESLLTLFTKSPSFPKKANSYLRENFGTCFSPPLHSSTRTNANVSGSGQAQALPLRLPTSFVLETKWAGATAGTTTGTGGATTTTGQPPFPIGERGPLKILYTTISHSNFNSSKNKYGFKLEIKNNQKKISILIKNLESNEFVDEEVYYTFEDLKKIINKKCRNIVFISAQHKKKNEIEYFKFQSAKLLTGMDFEKFLEGVEKGIIVYDIRIGIYKTGKNKGRQHDHGSAFRIKKNKIEEFFDVYEL